MRTMDDLKPCPFCGGKAFMWSWNGGTRIDCENWSGRDEQTHYVGVGARTEAEAIAAWNRRASDVESGSD